MAGSPIRVTGAGEAGSGFTRPADIASQRLLRVKKVEKLAIGFSLEGEKIIRELYRALALVAPGGVGAAAQAEAHQGEVGDDEESTSQKSNVPKSSDGIDPTAQTNDPQWPSQLSSVAIIEMQIYHKLALAHLQNLDLGTAMSLCRAVLRLAPKHPEVRRLLILLLTIRGKEWMEVAEELRWPAKIGSAMACFAEGISLCQSGEREAEELYMLQAMGYVMMEELSEACTSVDNLLRLLNSRYSHDKSTVDFDMTEKATSGVESVANGMFNARSTKDLLGEAYILRAKIFWARGHVDQGNQDIRCAAALVPSHPEVGAFSFRCYTQSRLLYESALKAIADGKASEALSMIDQALTITQDDVKLLLLRSKACRLCNSLQEAYESILRAQAIFESRLSVDGSPVAMNRDLQAQLHLILNDMAMDFASAGNYDQAILLFNKIVRVEEAALQKLSPTTGLVKSGPETDILVAQSKHQLSRFYMNRGDCYRALERLEEALEDYRVATRLARRKDIAPRLRASLTMYLLSVNVFNKGQFIEAEDLLNQAIEGHPGVADYYALRAKTRFFTGRFQEAAMDLRAALRLDPHNVELQQQLSQFDSEATSAPPASSAPCTQRSHKDSSSPIPKQRKSAMLAPVSRTVSRNHKSNAITSESHSHPTHGNTPHVLKIAPEPHDIIQMMLNPRSVRQLPTLKLLSTSSASSKRSGTSNSFGEGFVVGNPHLTGVLQDKRNRLAGHQRTITSLYKKRSEAETTTPWRPINGFNHVEARERPRDLNPSLQSHL